MPTFKHEIEIAAPIETVFEFNRDPDNWRRVTPALTDIEVIGETEDGLRLNGTWEMLGIATEGEMEFVIDEENHHTITSFDSPAMTGELHYSFSETDSGTKVVQEADYELGDSLLDRVIKPVAARYNKRQFKNTLQTSKELIEAETLAEA
jgi:ligand-binding SRPBCC domain-containing protein